MPNARARKFVDIWSDLTHAQRQYVIARQEHPTKKDAAEAIGVPSSTVYKWPDVVEDAVRLVQEEAISSALSMLTSGLAKAAMVKLAGLDSGDERVQQSAATEVLDRLLGKPTQRQEVTHDGALEVESETLSDVTAALLDRAGDLEDEE